MFNRKIYKEGDVAVFDMPALEDETKQGGEVLLRSIKDQQQRAYDEGFISGEKAGFQEGEQKAAVLIDRLTQIIEELVTFKERMVKDSEEQLVRLSLAIARKVINEEIQTRPEVIVTMVKEALKKLQRFGVITIKMNPALHDIIMKRKNELLEIHDDIVFDVSPTTPLTAPLVTSQIEEVVTDIESMISTIAAEMRENAAHY